MKKSYYYQGMRCQYFYNAIEAASYCALYRPTPQNLIYKRKVHYGKGQYEYMNLCCLKDNEKKKKPLFIYIHGGGWVSGIPEMRNRYVMNWADAGYLTAAINYSFAPQKIFPTQLKELFSAIDFIFDNREKFSADLENIVLSGESAGGYLIFYIASLINDKEKLKELGINFRHADEFKVKAIISHSGVFSIKNLMNDKKPQSNFPNIQYMAESFFGKDKKELEAYLESEKGSLASPVIKKDFPPTFMIWAERDFLKYESFEMIEKFKRLGVPFAEYKGEGTVGKHAWTIAPIFKRAKNCFELSRDFAEKYITH